jgi:hypothetical protein
VKDTSEPGILAWGTISREYIIKGLEAEACCCLVEQTKKFPCRFEVDVGVGLTLLLQFYTRA